MNEEITKTDTGEPAGSNAYVKPRYEVKTREDAYHIDVYMPGVTRKDAKITLEGDALTIEAKRAPHAVASWESLHREISDNEYRLHLQLNIDIDPEGITARSTNGILTVVLPVATKAAQRTIPIS